MSLAYGRTLRTLARRLTGIAALAWPALFLTLSLAPLPARAQATAPTYLYVSPTTQAYFLSAGGRYEAMLKPWRDLLAVRRSPCAS